MLDARLLYEDEYCVVRFEPAHRLLTYARKPARFPDNAAAGLFFGRMASLDARGADRLLLDVREAPPNNDPAWEAEFLRHAGRMFARFERRATLVRSQVGKLHAERLSRRGAGTDAFRIFNDEADARRWLMESDERGPPASD